MKHIKKYQYFILIIFLVIIIWWITIIPNMKPKPIMIDGEAALALMESNKSFIIDVRTPEEYNDGHIQNAINIPYEKISKETVIYDKNTKLLVYCQGGIRSKRAALKLIDLGFTKVYDIGGIDSYLGKIVK